MDGLTATSSGSEDRSTMDFAGRYLEGRDITLQESCGTVDYYGLPAVKKSEYHWRIGLSFFSAGTAGASQLLSTIIDYSGRPEDRRLVAPGRYAALAGSLLSPAIFVYTLHLTSRWYNMFRIVKTTSPMSLGAWDLTFFSGLSAAVAAGDVLDRLGLFRTAGFVRRLFEIPAALAGAVISVYMGTELEATSTPFWASSHPLLPVLFGVTNAGTGLAIFDMGAELARSSGPARDRLDRLALVTGAAQLIAAERVGKRWLRERRQAGLNTGVAGAFLGLAMAVGVLMPSLIRLAHLLSGERSRGSSLAASLGSLGAGMALPVLLVYAGNASARRPQDYFCYAKPTGP